MNITPGTHISEAAALVSSAATSAGGTVMADFNGVALIAEPGDFAADVEAAWQREMDSRAREYRQSPEYAQQQAEAEARRASLQAELDRLMAELPCLDFGNSLSLINWLERLAEPSDHVDVTCPWRQIVLLFEEHGYVAGANTGAAYDGDDAENSARYLIGQALASLRGDYLGAHGVHPVFHAFAREWRQQFPAAS
jgi:hypothetical protein